MKSSRPASQRREQATHGRLKHHRTCQSAGFTLIELLVVISIITIIFSILIPAMMAVRESARDAQCQTKVRDQVTAVLAFEGAKGHYPTGGVPAYTTGPLWNSGQTMPFGLVPRNDCGSSTTPCDDQNWGPFYQTLPFTELSRLYTERDTARIRGTLRPDLTCPSSPQQALVIFNEDFPDLQHSGARVDFAGTSYAFSVGTGTTLASCTGGPPPTNGFCVPAGVPTINSSSINDGLSQTICLGEAWVGLEREGQPYWGRVAGWTSGRAQSPTCGPIGWTATDTQRRVDVIFGPNIPADEDTVSPGNRSLNFGGWHPDGANFAFCDGSVRKISFGVDRIVFEAQGTRAGREEIDGL